MRVDHGGADVFVAEQFLHGPNVVAIFEQVGSEGMAQRVATGALVHVRFTHRAFDGSLQRIFQQVMAPLVARLRIERWLRGGKDPVPGPFKRRLRLFAFERVRQRNRHAPLPLRVESRADCLQVAAQRFRQGAGQGCHAIFSALALSHHDLSLPEIHVLDAQSQALADAQAAPVEQAGHEPVGIIQPFQNRCHLGAGEHHRQA